MQNPNRNDKPSRFWKLMNDSLGMMDKQDVLTEFAISERTLQRWRKEKILDFVKIRGKIFYRREDVLRLKEQQEKQ